jgi:2-oxoglutarate ferredoxin oxidoreductase subunit alpha
MNALTPVIETLSRTNDFVVKFANVNGSGSASANGMFAKAILRMGVPVAARNIFPSNIQGLPTWFEVRVSEAGHMGRRGGVDLMVAMNPQTWDKDLAEIEPGGYLFYDSTKPLPPEKFRGDIRVVGVPLTAICNAAYTDPRQRQLFKNIIYVGALAALLDIDLAVMEQLVGEQFKGKDRLIAPNIAALHMGRDYVAEHIGPLGLRVRPSDKVGDRIFVEGNNAAALGAVYGGATVCAWYPITPSTSLAEAFTEYCEKFRTEPETGKARYAIVQAEDEIASIGVVVGAGWNGARAFTCTSGPGISLMTEFVGLSYFAEIPAVIFDVQRGGPSTGMPTRTQQADILAAAYASHGDTKHPLLFPADPGECFEMGALAFDLSDRLQTTIFVMLDLDIGMNEWLTEPFKWDDTRRIDRGKVSRHPPGARRLFHPRHLAQPLRPLFGRGRGLCRQHAAAVAQVRDRQGPDPRADPPRRAPRHQDRRALFRLDHPGDERGVGDPGGARPPRRRHAPARLSLRRRGVRLHRRARAGLRGRTEPRRPAAHPDHERGRGRSG